MAEGGSDPMQQSQQGASITGEEELASKTLHIQSKRFYVDVKQNRRGRFIKIAEVSAGGRKSRILMSMNVASEFRDHLKTFDEHIRALGDFDANQQQQQSTDDGRLQSAQITRDDRKYYLDLKENERGRFLRISMVGANTPRTQIALPAQGVQELQNTLTQLLEEFGDEDDRDSIESPPAIDLPNLPDSKYLRVGNKHFYFDIGSNNRGIFLRISEVRGNLRTAITIPEKAWPRFRDNIDDFIQKISAERDTVSSSNRTTTPAAAAAAVNPTGSNSGHGDKASMSPSSSGDTKK